MTTLVGRQTAAVLASAAWLLVACGGATAPADAPINTPTAAVSEAASDAPIDLADDSATVPALDAADAKDDDGLGAPSLKRNAYAAASATPPSIWRALSDTELQTVQAGLAVWNKPDRLGMACVHCHASPDAFELAAFNFSRADLARRDAVHVSPVDSDALFSMIEVMRRAYQLNGRLLDPATDRPFQPGGDGFKPGQPLPGNTAAERDAAFGAELMAKLPELMGDRIDSIEKARAAKAALEEVYSRRALRVPVAFPRLSEDIERGADRGHLNDWMSELPLSAADAAGEQALQALQSAYLAEPSEMNLWALYRAIAKLTPAPGLPQDKLLVKMARMKRLAGLLMTHDLRQRAAGLPSFLAKPTGLRPLQSAQTGLRGYPVNPFRAVGDAGDFATLQGLQSLPSVITDRLTALHPDRNTNLKKHSETMTVDWWLMGTIMDPAVNVDRNAYWLGRLNRMESGEDKLYPLMKVFMWTRQHLYQGYDNTSVASGGSMAFDHPDHFIMNFGFASAEHRALYQRFTANAWRLHYWLTLDTAQQRCAQGKGGVLGGMLPGQTEQRDEENMVTEWLLATEPQHAAEDRALVQLARAKAAESQRGCGAEPAAAGGTGLKAELFDNPLVQGTPVNVRTEPVIDFSRRDTAPPYTCTPTARGSVRWTGQIVPRYSETYRFRIYTKNKVRTFTVGGEPIQREGRNSLKVTAGQLLPVVIELEQTRNCIDAQLYWMSARQAFEIIPTAQLLPQ
jgi:PA14 domain